MKRTIPCMILVALAIPCMTLSQDLRPPEEKEVKWVSLVNIEAEEALPQLKETLKKLNVYIHYKAISPSPSLILLSGEREDIMVCAEILAALDRASVEPTPAKLKVKHIPLSQVGSRSARAMLEELLEKADYDTERGRFILYPEGDAAALFYIGTGDDAVLLTELTKGIDQPHYRTKADILRKWWRDFSIDFLQSLQRVLSYLACALFLLLLHAVISNIPVIGRHYRKYMGVIWGKLLAGFKGQDFALSLIEVAARHGAAVAAGTRAASGEERYSVALNAATRYLKFRGLDTADAQVSALLRDMITARMSRK